MNLELRQSQSHELSTVQLQRLKILQYSIPELNQYILDQYQENVMLDLIPAAEACVSYDASPVQPDHVRGQNANDDPTDIDLIGGCSFGDYPGQSLYTYLKWQLKALPLEPQQYQCACFLAACLNDRGYLEEELEELSTISGLPVSALENALSVVQTLEPAGVGARTLAECLCLQLKRQNDAPELAIRIVETSLNELASHQYKKIAQKLGVMPLEAAKVCEQIRNLNPYPCLEFSQEEKPEYIVPDFLIRVMDGMLTVRYTRMLPELKISDYYDRMLRQSEDPEVQDYLKKKKENATWIIRAIRQRESTISSCVNQILADQQYFFLHMGSGLRPVTLTATAERLGVHPSTLSRAVKNKYIQTDFGVFPMGYFFTSALTTEKGQDVSNTDIKQRIAAMIKEEDKRHPLSDQTIARLLSDSGVCIARRTVAKYREQLRIENASVRKSTAG